MDRLLVRVQGTEDGTRVDVEDLVRRSTVSLVKHRRSGIQRDFCPQSQNPGFMSTKTCTYLNQASIISRHNKLSVPSYVPTPRNVFEPGDSFSNFLRPWCVYLDASGSGDGIAMWFGRGKVNGSDRSVFLDKDRVLELSPVSALGVVLYRCWSCMPLHDDWLVVCHRRASARARRRRQ